jgi:transcriptional regulator of acetoin/glycerol metabolism
MEEYGISACVLSSPAAANDATGQEARDIARRTNEVLAEIVSRHPARFGAVATLPGLDADGALAESSARKRRMKKQIDHIPRETMSALCSYDWPGNIRELQNRIERAVILSKDGVFSNPLPMPESSEAANFCPFPTTLKEVERTTILSALEDRGWVVGGPEGAAVKLGLPRTTLISMMERLGICRPVTSDVAL